MDLVFPFENFLIVFQLFYFEAFPLQLPIEFGVHVFKLLDHVPLILIVKFSRHVSLRISLHSRTRALLVHELIQSGVYSHRISLSSIFVLKLALIGPLFEVGYFLRKIFFFRNSDGSYVQFLALVGETLFLSATRSIFIVFDSPVLINIFFVVALSVVFVASLLRRKFVVLNGKVLGI